MIDSMPTLIHLEHFSLFASIGSAAGIPLTGDDLDRHFKNQCGQNRSELQKEVEAIVTNPIALKYMSGAQRDVALNREPSSSSSSSYPRNTTTTSDTDHERVSIRAPSSSFPTSSGASRANLNSASVLSMQTLSKRKDGKKRIQPVLIQSSGNGITISAPSLSSYNKFNDNIMPPPITSSDTNVNAVTDINTSDVSPYAIDDYMQNENSDQNERQLSSADDIIREINGMQPSTIDNDMIHDSTVSSSLGETASVILPSLSSVHSGNVRQAVEKQSSSSSSSSSSSNHIGKKRKSNDVVIDVDEEDIGEDSSSGSSDSEADAEDKDDDDDEGEGEVDEEGVQDKHFESTDQGIHTATGTATGTGTGTGTEKGAIGEAKLSKTVRAAFQATKPFGESRSILIAHDTAAKQSSSIAGTSVLPSPATPLSEIALKTTSAEILKKRTARKEMLENLLGKFDGTRPVFATASSGAAGTVPSADTGVVISDNVRAADDTVSTIDTIITAEIADANANNVQEEDIGMDIARIGSGPVIGGVGGRGGQGRGRGRGRPVGSRRDDETQRMPMNRIFNDNTSERSNNFGGNSHTPQTRPQPKSGHSSSNSSSSGLGSSIKRQANERSSNRSLLTVTFRSHEIECSIPLPFSSPLTSIVRVCASDVNESAGKGIFHILRKAPERTFLRGARLTPPTQLRRNNNLYLNSFSSIFASSQSDADNNISHGRRSWNSVVTGEITCLNGARYPTLNIPNKRTAQSGGVCVVGCSDGTMHLLSLDSGIRLAPPIVLGASVIVTDACPLSSSVRVLAVTLDGELWVWEVSEYNGVEVGGKENKPDNGHFHCVVRSSLKAPLAAMRQRNSSCNSNVHDGRDSNNNSRTNGVKFDMKGYGCVDHENMITISNDDNNIDGAGLSNGSTTNDNRTNNSGGKNTGTNSAGGNRNRSPHASTTPSYKNNSVVTSSSAYTSFPISLEQCYLSTSGNVSNQLSYFSYSTSIVNIM